MATSAQLTSETPTRGKRPPMHRGRFGVVTHLAAFLSGDPTGLFLEGYRAHGPVFGISLGFKTVAVLMGPEAHAAFFKMTDETLNMNEAYSFLRAMFGDIAFTAPVDVYERQRPALHAPFKAGKMPVYVKAMQTEVQAWLDSLGPAGEIDLVRALGPVVQHVAGSAFMGPTFNRDVGERFWLSYGDLVAGLSPILPPWLPLPRFRKRDRARAALEGILLPIVRERRRNPTLHDDFMQELVTVKGADGIALTEEEIVHLFMALMFAGHETTVGQAAWTLIELLRHPAEAARVQAEVDANLVRGEDLTPETLRALPYLGYALREIERMHPSAQMLLRMVKEDTQVGDHTLPAGWLAFVAAGAAHRMDSFGDPDVFRPARFAPGGTSENLPASAMIGFGGGRHKCTGMNFANLEMMTIVGLALQQFEFELVTTDPTTDYSVGAPRPGPTVVRYRRKARGGHLSQT